MTKDSGGPDRSFEERLRAARDKQGLDTPPRAPDTGLGESGTSALGAGLRVGLELVAAFVVAVAIGYGLDRAFGTLPILTVVFIPLGGAAGIVNIYRMFAPKPRDRSKTGGQQGGG